MDHSGGTKWASLAPNGPKKVAKMVSDNTIFSRFSTTSTPILAFMVGQMLQKRSKHGVHIYSK